MNMLERYLKGKHVYGGRGPNEWDCWGLTRAVRHDVYGLPLLPSYGAIADGDKRALTQACLRESRNFQIVDPCPAAIATVWRGRLCTHVAVVVEVDGRLAVLETNPNTGPRWLRIPDFERKYLKVVYYHDG